MRDQVLNFGFLVNSIALHRAGCSRDSLARQLPDDGFNRGPGNLKQADNAINNSIKTRRSRKVFRFPPEVPFRNRPQYRWDRYARPKQQWI